MGREGPGEEEDEEHEKLKDAAFIPKEAFAKKKELMTRENLAKEIKIGDPDLTR